MRASLVDRAYQSMRRRILDNGWPPGYRALERELALTMGMSRTPVREALITLAKEGLVEIVPRHGMRVLPVSPEDLRDIHDMLTALESMAAELVVMRRPTAAQLKPLIDVSRDMTNAFKADDLVGWVAADELFHRQLVEMCGNRLLIGAVRNCWDRAHRARITPLRIRPDLTHSTQEHMDVLEKIRKGDARGAFETHRVHRERGGREFLAIRQV